MPADVGSLARAYTNNAIRCLAAAVNNPPKGTPLATRITAAVALLDRGWGRPPQKQEHGGVNGKSIEIIVRHIDDGKD